MELRLSRGHVVALNFVLIVLLAYFAASSINDVIRWSLIARTPVALAPRPSVYHPVARHPRSYYEAIVRRDLFNRSQPHVSAPIAKEDLNIKLVGTSQLTLAKPFAIIADRTGRQSLFRTGDKIPGIGRLLAVEENRVIIDYHGRRVAVELPNTRARLSASVIHVAPWSASKDEEDDDEVRRLGPNHYQIQRTTIDESFLDLGDLLSEMRATPHRENGKTNGFALSEIEPGSVFEEMGLKDGDIVTHVGGQPLSSATEAMRMIPLLRTRDSIRVKVIRDGSPLTLRYDIR